MNKLRVDYTLKELCDALDVSRSGYLAWKKRPPSTRELSNARLVDEMEAIHSHRHYRSYGSPRMLMPRSGGRLANTFGDADPPT